MGRRVDVNDLVGTHEIAERLGLSSSQLVRDWRRRYPDDFPEPVLALKVGLIWSWSEVEDWLHRTGRNSSS